MSDCSCGAEITSKVKTDKGSKEQDYEDYLTRYVSKIGITKEDAEKHVIVRMYRGVS